MPAEDEDQHRREAAVDHVVQELRSRLADLERLEGTVSLDLGHGSIFIDGCHDPVLVRLGDDEADCRFRLSVELLSEILAGRRNGFEAFTAGEISAEGDMSVAVALQPLLAPESR